MDQLGHLGCLGSASYLPLAASEQGPLRSVPTGVAHHCFLQLRHVNSLPRGPHAVGDPKGKFPVPMAALLVTRSQVPWPQGPTFPESPASIVPEFLAPKVHTFSDSPTPTIHILPESLAPNVCTLPESPAPTVHILPESTAVKIAFYKISCHDTKDK
jgi:hypothetical protein